MLLLTSQRIEYIRASALHQNPERQLDGVALDKYLLARHQLRIQTGRNSRPHSIMSVQGILSSSIPWTGWRVTSNTCSGLSSWIFLIPAFYLNFAVRVLLLHIWLNLLRVSLYWPKAGDETEKPALQSSDWTAVALAIGAAPAYFFFRNSRSSVRHASAFSSRRPAPNTAPLPRGSLARSSSLTDDAAFEFAKCSKDVDDQFSAW
ncbi:hypothetical protein SAMN05216387_101206 [Nitrosovibrio tenuis]|uniref:Uncharacterized protein n=1 Tax=Nitrosovibrio tenuis TaxID=1233 RepID=A0A1H7G8B8_9PROT|nr:hypothetical protein SAMN05216387_101206 [Nitrosovibrio tenuis]